MVTIVEKHVSSGLVIDALSSRITTGYFTRIREPHSGTRWRQVTRVQTKSLRNVCDDREEPRSKSYIHWLTFECQNTENTLMDAVERFAFHEALKALEAECELADR